MKKLAVLSAIILVFNIFAGCGIAPAEDTVSVDYSIDELYAALEYLQTNEGGYKKYTGYSTGRMSMFLYDTYLSVYSLVNNDLGQPELEKLTVFLDSEMLNCFEADGSTVGYCAYFCVLLAELVNYPVPDRFYELAETALDKQYCSEGFFFPQLLESGTSVDEYWSELSSDEQTGMYLQLMFQTTRAVTVLGEHLQQAQREQIAAFLAVVGSTIPPEDNLTDGNIELLSAMVEVLEALGDGEYRLISVYNEPFEAYMADIIIENSLPDIGMIFTIANCAHALSLDEKYSEYLQECIQRHFSEFSLQYEENAIDHMFPVYLITKIYNGLNIEMPTYIKESVAAFISSGERYDGLYLFEDNNYDLSETYFATKLLDEFFDLRPDWEFCESISDTLSEDGINLDDAAAIKLRLYCGLDIDKDGVAKGLSNLIARNLSDDGSTISLYHLTEFMEVYYLGGLSLSDDDKLLIDEFINAYWDHNDQETDIYWYRFLKYCGEPVKGSEVLDAVTTMFANDTGDITWNVLVDIEKALDAYELQWPDECVDTAAAILSDTVQTCMTPLMDAGTLTIYYTYYLVSLMSNFGLL